MDVSIIIVNYNTLQMTRECIASIQRFTHGIKYEIIVVDNASSDGSKEYFENRKDITYIYSHTNLGFGKANNLASKRAIGKYLFFLNSDTLLRNNAINILHDYINLRPKVGAVGGNLFNANSQPTTSFERNFPGIYGCINLLSHGLFNRIRFGKNLMFNYSGYPIDVAYISGADLMISKALFERLVGFSPEYFMYYEETDLCYRIHTKDYKITSVPTAEIIHLEGGSQQKTTSELIKKTKIVHKSRQKYIERNHSRLYYRIDRILYLLYLILREIKFSNEVTRSSIQQVKNS